MDFNVHTFSKATPLTKRIVCCATILFVRIDIMYYTQYVLVFVSNDEGVWPNTNSIYNCTYTHVMHIN